MDTSDFDRAADALERFPQLAGDRLEAAQDRAADVARAAIRSAGRRHSRTGRMGRFVGIKATGRGFGRETIVHAGGAVAHLIAGGTRPHEIRPSHGRALAMGSIAGGFSGFAAHVEHPGTRPDPFVARGLRASEGERGRIIDTAVRDIAHELADRMEG